MMPSTRSCRFGTLLVTLLVVVLSTGCATTNDATRTRTEGAAAGAAVGALIGNLASGGNRTVGTLVGALVGGVVGYAVGDHVANKKEAFAKQEDYLKAVAAEADRVAADARARNSRLEDEIAKLNEEARTISAGTQSVRTRNTNLAAHKKKAHDLLAEATQALARLTEEIEIQRAVVVREKPTAPPQSIQLVTGNISELEIEKRALELYKAQLEQIDSRRAY